jgi:hypothetical protein
MADERPDENQIEWLPPQAEGGAAPPPRFDPARPDPLVQPPPEPRPEPPQWQQTPSQPWPQPYGKATTNSSAVASLVCGIGGLVAFVFPAGFGLVYIFNLPLSNVAWVFGVRGKRRVARGETHEHEGMANTGMVLGIVGTVLGVLAVVGWALAIAFSEEVRDELRRQIEEAQEQ